MTFVAVLRILFLLCFRRPVLARVIDVGLSEAERLYERDMHMVAHFDDIPTTDDIPYRPTSVRIAYEIDGREYRQNVRLIRRSGELPRSHAVIWYDPRDPHRVTVSGPASAIVLILIAGGLAVAGWHITF